MLPPDPVFSLLPSLRRLGFKLHKYCMLLIFNYVTLFGLRGMAFLASCRDSTPNWKSVLVKSRPWAMATSWIATYCYLGIKTCLIIYSMLPKTLNWLTLFFSGHKRSHQNTPSFFHLNIKTKIVIHYFNKTEWNKIYLIIFNILLTDLRYLIY